MCIRDRGRAGRGWSRWPGRRAGSRCSGGARSSPRRAAGPPVSYTHLRAHETVLDLVCRLLLEKKKKNKKKKRKKKKKTTHELLCEDVVSARQHDNIDRITLC